MTHATQALVAVVGGLGFGVGFVTLGVDDVTFQAAAVGLPIALACLAEVVRGRPAPERHAAGALHPAK